MSELLKINVNEHVEKKNGLTYLSWAWAWAEVLKLDHGATWVVHTYGQPGSEEPCMRVGKSAMVHVSVTIKGLRRECMLPVMDHRNKAIPDPDAFQVNTAIMRCLAKAIAMHGLGLYIYAGEDLPEEDKASAVIAPARIAAEEAASLLTDTEKEAIYRDLDDVLALAEGGKTTPLIDFYYSLPTNEHKMLAWAEIPSTLRAMLNRNRKEK